VARQAPGCVLGRVDSPSSHRLGRCPRWLVWTIAIVVVALVGIRLALPSLLQREINRKLSEVPGYSGHVGRIGVHLYRGAYSLHEVEIRKEGGAVSQPFFSASVIDFSLAWGQLFHGKIVSKIFIDGGRINFVKGPAEENSQLKVDRRWQDVVNAIFPIAITRLEIKDGLLHYLDTANTPKVDVYIRNLHAAATGLQNRPSRKGDQEFPATISLEGDSIGNGHLTINVQAEPLADQPHFYLTLSLQDVALPALNDFLEAYTNVTVSSGNFRLFVEVAARGGRFEGYVKPFFEHVVIAPEAGKKNGLWREVWGTVVGAMVELFKNKPKDQFATKIPIAGDFSDFRTGAWKAIGNMLHHGFVKALPEDIEGKINAEEVTPKRQAAGSQPVQPGASSH
jgi:hypothetical protein